MMIEDVNKALSEEMIDDIVTRILAGENLGQMLESLSPISQKVLEGIIEEYQQNNQASGIIQSQTLEHLRVADYISDPPTMEQFIEDDYYLGTLMKKSDETEGMFPAWKEILCRDFNYDSAIHNAVITGSLGIGKCLGHNELCLMYDGTVKAVQDVKTADNLMGDDSTPRQVISTMKGRGPLYQIYPAKGVPFTCNGEHVLCLKTSTSDEITEVTVNDFIKWPTAKRHTARIYRTGCDWPERPVRIDPYWFGLWLGDGTARRIEITTMDEAIRHYFCDYAKSFGLQEKVYTVGKGAKAASYCFTIKGGRWIGENKLMALLRSYGLSTPESCYVKFIPRDYLINSKDVRMKLLAGLLDTDGSKCLGGKCTDGKTAKKNNGTYEIATKYEKLADQIRFLAQSLGYFAQTKIKIVNSTAYWKTTISGAYDIPTLLTRKQSQEQRHTVSPLTGHIRKADCLRTKFAVIPKGEGDYYGFEIDGNHRYLLGDFTVTHNTFVMVVILMYRILLATLLRNPYQFFGLTKGTKIIFNFLSITKAAVTETAFGDAMNFMANSPYFLEECRYNPDSTYTNFRIHLKGSIWLTAGSKGQHLLGRNIIGVGLDEGNWRLEAEPDTKAYELFNEVRNRINNRFRKVIGYLPALSILASSAKDESSFTETIIKEIEKTNDPLTQKVYRNSVYKIKRHTLQLGPKWFKVAYGLKNIAPIVLSGWYSEDGKPIGQSPHEGSPPGASVELVPLMYHDEFKRRPLNALRDVCGISTGGVNRWFGSLIDYERCVELAEKDGLTSPVIGKTELLPLSMEDGMQLWDYLEHKKFCTRVQSQIIPKRHPGQLRYSHIDLATQGMAGIAICHLVGTQLVENVLNPKDMIPYSEYRLVVEYDFILTCIAGQVKAISLEKIQNFIFWLSKECGFNFGLISFDQWQSEMSLQMLESRGFKVEKQSIDRNKDAYINLRSAAEELRLRPYRHRHLEWELENLLDGEKKVDHPPKISNQVGSKDTSDAVAGALNNALNSEEKISMLASNNPRIHATRDIDLLITESPPIEIILPPGYDRLKTFKV